MTGISFNPTPIFYVIVGLLIGMVIGWLIGFFDSNGRSAKKIQASEAQAEAAIAEANSKISLAEQRIASANRSSQNTQDDPGLLRLKTGSGGRITVEMDGAIIVPPLQYDKRRRLIELVSVFRSYLETGQLSQASIQPSASTQTPPGLAATQSVASQPLPVAAPKPEAEKITSTLSIVGQIDTVLQKRLMNSPLFKRGIRLQDSIRGGVDVYIGSQKYGTIDDVPDEDVKSEIRAAIAEWETRFTPR